MNARDFFDGKFKLTKELNINGGSLGPTDSWGASKFRDLYNPDWDKVFKQDPDTLLKANPFQPSMFRDGGYSMWDFILANGPTHYRSETVGRKFQSQSFIRPIKPYTLNYHWGAVQTMFLQGVRNFPWSINLDSHREGRNLLNLIHTIAHLEHNDEPFRSSWEHQHTANSDNMLKAAAYVGAAAILNMPLKLTCEPEPTTRMPYGIYVSYSMKTGFTQQPPLLQVPVNTSKMDMCDKIFAVLHVLVEVGSDPIEDILPGHTPHIWNDWWGFQPKRITLLGWETMDTVASMDVAASDRNSLQLSRSKGAYVMHPHDLFPPDTLKYYIEYAKAVLGTDVSYKNIYDWMHTADYFLHESRTPFLPCNCCFLKNRQIDSMISIPSESMPRTTWKDSEEWSTYGRRVKEAMKHVARAKKEYYPGDFIRDRAQHRRNFENTQSIERRKLKAKGKW